MINTIKHYAFDQRVHLRRDPSQFGRIGCGGYGDVYDFETRTQLIFWEHEGCDVVTLEKIDDLMSEEEYHERRRQFFSVMRRPEMRVLLAALQHLHIDQAIDWRAIQSIEIERWGTYSDCWMMLTDKYQIYTIWADSPKLSIYDFSTCRLHDENDPLCDCESCQESRICHVDMKDYYSQFANAYPVAG